MRPRGQNAIKLIREGVCSHHMCPGLQIFEVLFLYSCHHPVVLQVLSHLHVVRVGLEEGVGSCHRLVQLVDLKRHTQGFSSSSLIQGILIKP